MSHDWRQRGGVPVLTWDNVEGRNKMAPSPAWRSCNGCGVSDGMAEHMGWRECSQAPVPSHG